MYHKKRLKTNYEWQCLVFCASDEAWQMSNVMCNISLSLKPLNILFQRKIGQQRLGTIVLMTGYILRTLWHDKESKKLKADVPWNLLCLFVPGSSFHFCDPHTANTIIRWYSLEIGLWVFLYPTKRKSPLTTQIYFPLLQTLWFPFSATYPGWSYSSETATLAR